jgi:PHP family Zn ribbon phosphoesterase
VKKWVLYKCKCGCLNVEDDMIYIRAENKSGNKTNRRVCKNHTTIEKGALSYRLTNCVDCGSEFNANPGGKVNLRCQSCQRERKIARMRNYYKKQRNQKPVILKKKPVQL